ncbi:MAG: hypothetical protein LBE08_10855 [Bifidobacteriaceae bacterium]|jgi:tetratricopeptide (TPR) repeat protein|nr:hypothetical protein [Bifidobacteriaceae bacterium]
MTATPDHSTIQALLGQIDETPPGPEEFALTRRAVELAQAAGDEELEYRARMRLTASASHNGDAATELSSFAWCLAKHDADPARFPAEVDGAPDLLWQYKWLPPVLDRSASFSLEQTEALIDDMEEHYRRAGVGLSAVIAERFAHAWITGRTAEALALRARLIATARDDHSDCEACSLAKLADFAVENREYGKALKLIDRIIEEGLACVTEPAYALSVALMPMLHAGRFEDAKAAHARSYRLARAHPDSVGTLANNLIFCAITGNQARALRLAERHLTTIAKDALNDEGRLWLLVALGITFDSLERASQGHVGVRGSDRPEVGAALGLEADMAAGRVWTASALGAKVWAAVDQLAGAFDARNGNSYISGQVAVKRAHLDQPYDLPLEAEVFLPPLPPAAAPSDALGLLELAYSADTAEAEVGYARRVLELTAGTSPDAAPPDPATAPAPRWAEAGTADDLRLGARRALIAGLVAQDLLDEAGAALADLLADLHALGRKTEAAAEAPAGLALYGAGDTRALQLALAQAEALGSPGHSIARMAFSLANQWLAADNEQAPDQEPDQDRSAAIARLVSLAIAQARPGSITHVGARVLQTHMNVMAATTGPDTDSDTDPRHAADREVALAAVNSFLTEDLPGGTRASLLNWRARLLANLGRFAEGAAAADEATALNTRLGLTRQAAEAAELAGQMLHDSGDLTAAAARFRHAIRSVELEGGYAAGTRFALARVLFEMEQTWQAVEAFTEVAEFEEANGAPAHALADTYEYLGRAAHYDGEPNDALRHWEHAADLWASADHPEGTARCYWRQGNLLRGHQQFESAVMCLDQAFDVLEAAQWREHEPLRDLAIGVLEARAMAKGWRADESALEDLAAARQVALEGDAVWRAADLLDTRARVLMGLERPREAVSQFLEAADAYRAADDPIAGSSAEFSAAKVTSGSLSRDRDARVLAEAALAALPAPSDPDAASLAEAIKSFLDDLT